MKPTRWILLAASVISATTLYARDWPQYRGANHDGTSTDSIIKAWPTAGLTPIWQVSVNKGLSSFAASQGIACTLVTRMFNGTNAETCVALALSSGQEIWATPVGRSQYDSGAGTGDGPRSTPTVDGTNVYVFTSWMTLHCLRTNDGAVVWAKSLRADYYCTYISWQSAASPLIDGDLLFVNCNGKTNTLLALNKNTGQQVWLRHKEALTQATPVAATILGVRQIIFYTQSGLVSVAPETGDVLWRYAFSYNGTSTAASPVVAGDVVYCSATYGSGAAAVRLTKPGSSFVVTELWRKTGDSVGNHWSTPVHYQGYIYGIYGHYGTGILKCFELATGRLCWSAANLSSGGVLLVDDGLLVLGESGYLYLVDPNPTAYTELAKAKILDGKSWNSPAVYDGRILARSTTTAVYLDTAAKPPAKPVRLQALPRLENGNSRLLLKNADDSPVDEQRTGQISVWATTNIFLPAAEWFSVPGTWAPTNGMLWFEDSQSAGSSTRFYRTQEN